MPAARLMQIDSHAIATLRHIRNSMDAATSIAIPGSSGIAMGIVGLAATAVSYTPRFHEHWIFIWLLAAIVATGLGGALLARRASGRGLARSVTQLSKFALCLLPSLFAGAVLTAVFWFSEQAHYIAGTWLLLYGCALMAVSTVTTRMVAVMGGLFVALGPLALLLPAALHVALLGIGFGGLHIVFGILMARTGHERQA